MTTSNKPMHIEVTDDDRLRAVLRGRWCDPVMTALARVYGTPKVLTVAGGIWVNGRQTPMPSHVEDWIYLWSNGHKLTPLRFDLPPWSTWPERIKATR